MHHSPTDAIKWTSVSEVTPQVGEWVLAAYQLGNSGIWRRRIYEWRSGKHHNRKITHWCYINNPH